MKRHTGRTPLLLGVTAMGALVVGSAAGAQVHGDTSAATAPSAHVPTLQAEIELDGLLDESVWQQAAVLTDFVEVEPVEGRAASPPSEVLMWRTRTHLHIGLRFWEPEPNGMVVQNMHRYARLSVDDRVQFILDTFHDENTAYFFQLGASGSRGDGLVSSNGQVFNKRWDGLWQAEAQIPDDRWTAEISIPFRTMACGESGVWGANFERFHGPDRQKSRWSLAERKYKMMTVQGIGTLSGFEQVDQGLGLTFTPYFKTKRLENQLGNADWDVAIGGDVEWWISPQLRLSLTANTDFAETEVDPRRVNLSQYSLFFPERRDFFLEDANLFEFGPGGQTVIPFYSRRIGLVEGEEVGVHSGARLSGRLGRWDLGLLATRTEATTLEDSTAVPEGELFVVRPNYHLRSDMAIGGIFTYGDPETNSGNMVTGADWHWNTTAFGSQLLLNAYTLRSSDDASNEVGGMIGGRAIFNATDWRWSTEVHAALGTFEPALGYVARQEQTLIDSEIAWEPRPASSSSIRKYLYSIEPRVWLRNSDRVMSHEIEIVPFGLEWHDGARFEVEAAVEGDRVESNDFSPGGVDVPAGLYSWERIGVDWISAKTLDFVWQAEAAVGSWYDGTLA